MERRHRTTDERHVFQAPAYITHLSLHAENFHKVSRQDSNSWSIQQLKANILNWCFYTFNDVSNL